MENTNFHSNTCPATVLQTNPSREKEYSASFSEKRLRLLTEMYENLKLGMERLEFSNQERDIFYALVDIKNILLSVENEAELAELEAELSDSKRVLFDVERRDKTRWQLLASLEDLYNKLEKLVAEEETKRNRKLVRTILGIMCDIPEIASVERKSGLFGLSQAPENVIDKIRGVINQVLEEAADSLS